MKNKYLYLIAILTTATIAWFWYQNYEQETTNELACNEQTIVFHENNPAQNNPIDTKITTPILSNELAIDNNNYHIFFDVGHVLLHNSGTMAAKAVGVSNMLWYTVKHKKTPDHKEIQGRLFAFIDHCTKRPRGSALFNDEQLPGLMCDWVKGHIKSTELLNTILSYEKEANEFFISTEEKNLVLGTLALFKPDVICKIQRPVAKMVKFFQDCNQAFPGRIYILSNWDGESAKLVRKKYPQIFNIIKAQNIFFSGDIGQVKPEASVFNYITDHLNLDPKKCILIDDNQVNIAAAEALAWQTILHTSPEDTILRLKGIISAEQLKIL